MSVQLDPLGPLRKVWAMRHGPWLVIPALSFTVIFILAAILFAIHQGIKFLDPSSKGIMLLPQIAQEPWLPTVASGFAVALVVLWVVIIVLAVATPEPSASSSGKQDMPLPSATTDRGPDSKGTNGAPSQASPQLHIENPGGRSFFENHVLITNLRLAPTFDMQVESMELEINGKKTPASNWKSTKVTSGHDGFRMALRFEVPDWISPGTHQARLLAWAGGTWWASTFFPVDFPNQ